MNLTCFLIVYIFCIFIITFLHLFYNKFCYLIFFLFNGVQVSSNEEGEEMSPKNPFNSDLNGFISQRGLLQIYRRFQSQTENPTEEYWATECSDPCMPGSSPTARSKPRRGCI